MISVEDERQRYSELRLQSLRLWRGRVVFLVWTPRGDDTAHLISCRYADRKETDNYFLNLSSFCNRGREGKVDCQSLTKIQGRLA
jgi:hypothetical protein